jgi:catechol 2,3-dioxygenase
VGITPNRTEIVSNSNVNNYGDNWTSIGHIQNSPQFARRALGVFVDPDKMVAARKAGASPWNLHKRGWQGEFEPAHPYNPAAVL